ncbi:MAG: alpha-mannosidase, partial [Clostridia bacterium]|nr:alpha-mannosidase [Clostridia bacterium]
MVNTNIPDKYFRLERAQRLISLISGLATPESCKVSGWKFTYGDFYGPESPDFDDSSWDVLSEGFDSYGGINTYFWIRNTVTVPREFEGKPVRLYVSTCPNEGWHHTNPNFIVFINGKAASAFDRNHSELTLTACAKGGESFSVALKGFTAMKGTALCSFSANIRTVDPRIEKFCYDVKVPMEVCVELPERDPARLRMEYLIDRAVNLLDVTEPGSEDFFLSLEDAQKYMDDEFYGKFCSENPKVFTRVIGHTHLDVAWLWPIRQTREKTARTFANMLHYMEEYPEFKFMSSQPCIYNWVKNDYPELFERIRQAVKDGRWEADGGMWVEADCNLTSGEGFVRQFLYGKRFLKEEFDVDSKILWLPDVFGYSAALPQILKKCGIDYFMTTKISWNNYDRIPNDTFIWRGIDGSEVFSHFVCVADILNASKNQGISTYNGKLNASQMMGSVRRFLNGDICNETLASVGFGDGGGGTTREMIENGRRLAQNIPGAPGVYWGFALDYFKKWEKELEGNPFLAKWFGELYLEVHRGTLTSQADNKRDNRKSEFLYQLAETICYTDKELLGGNYPKEMFDKNWLTILTNQFHDILPGSSIREVYEDSARDYATVLGEANDAVNTALTSIATNVCFDGSGILCYNPTGISDRSDICTVDGEFDVYDGETHLCSQISDGRTSFIASGIPAKGWKTFKAVPHTEDVNPLSHAGNTFENSWFKVT